MTTERRRPKRETRLRVSSLELRLYVAALLAGVYTISWRAIGGHVPVTEPTTAPAPVAPEPRQRMVWLDSVPPSMRPPIAVPAGWQIASEPAAPSFQPARVVRVPSHRAPRVRTRSS